MTAVPIGSTIDQDSRSHVVKEANQEDEEEVEIKTLKVSEESKTETAE